MHHGAQQVTSFCTGQSNQWKHQLPAQGDQIDETHGKLVVGAGGAGLAAVTGSDVSTKDHHHLGALRGGCDSSDAELDGGPCGGTVVLEAFATLPLSTRTL